MVEPCDLAVESADNYVRSYSLLKDYVHNLPTCSLVDIGRLMRRLLEGCLRSHFPPTFHQTVRSVKCSAQFGRVTCIAYAGHKATAAVRAHQRLHYSVQS